MAGFTRETALASSTIRLAATGDTVAFARIVAAFHGDMTRVAYVVAAGDGQLAEDAVQAAWTVAWTRLDSLRDPGRIRSWLVAIAANEARQACRREHRRAVRQIEVGERDLADGRSVGADPAGRVSGLDLERVIGSLSADERKLLALRYEAGLDSSEIGSLEGRPAATIRWQLARLLARLRKELADA